MNTYQTNSDKILQAVIVDEQLINCYNYNPGDYSSISDALNSDIAIIRALALIIDRNELGASDKEIYNEVNNFLKSNI